MGTAQEKKSGAGGAKSSSRSTHALGPIEDVETIDAALGAARIALTFVPAGRAASIVRMAIPVARFAMKNPGLAIPAAKKAVSAGKEAASKVIAATVESARKAAAPTTGRPALPAPKTPVAAKKGIAFGIGRFAGRFFRTGKKIAKDTAAAYRKASR